MQVESEQLASHIVERLDKHLTVFVTRLSAIEDTVHGGTRSGAAASSADRSVTDRLRDVEASLQRLNEGSQVVTGSAAAAAADGASGGGDVQSILVSTSEKMTIYEGVITVLNREVEKLSTQVLSLIQSRTHRHSPANCLH